MLLSGEQLETIYIYHSNLLSKIFFNISDSIEDLWSVKAKKHEELYKKYIQIAFLTFDRTGDGDKTGSKNSLNVSRMYR